MDKIYDALATPGAHVAAWNLQTQAGFVSLAAYRVGPEGATELAVARLPDAEKANITEALEARGVAVGGYDLACEHIWVRRPDYIEAWDRSAQAFRYDASSGVHTADGNVIKASEIAEVTVYTSADLGERGIALSLASGDKRIIAREFSEVPAADPAYTRNELLWDTAWAAVLGRALAKATGAKYNDAR